MNFQKYFKSTALINNPLCGIDTYKDVLNLATGQITRAIKKLVLTGTEVFYRDMEREGSWRFYSDRLISTAYNTAICSSFENIGTDGVNNSDNIGFCIFYKSQFGCRFPKSIASTIAEFKSYLANLYAAETPVTIWYVLATPETEPITVPSGLSGTVEGYLTQTGTPSPTNPIYPVANDAVGWYGIKNYVRATTWQDGSTYSRSGGSWSSSLTKKRSRKKK